MPSDAWLAKVIQEESDDAANLIRGVRLLLLHPEIPSCEMCCAWQYDEHWRRLGTTDRDRRDPGDSTPCWRCPKIVPGEPATPESGRKAELSEKNWTAFMHYQACRATYSFPDDPIVRDNAALIFLVEGQVARQAAAALIHELSAIALGVAKRRG